MSTDKDELRMMSDLVLCDKIEQETKLVGSEELFDLVEELIRRVRRNWEQPRNETRNENQARHNEGVEEDPTD